MQFDGSHVHSRQNESCQGSSLFQFVLSSESHYYKFAHCFKYKCFKKLNIFRGTEVAKNDRTPHKRLKPSPMLLFLGEMTFEHRYPYAALQKPGKAEQLCKKRFITTAESGLSKTELCKGVLVDSAKKCSIFSF